MASSSSSIMENQLCEPTVNFTNYITVRPSLKDKHKEVLIYNIWKEQMVCLLDSHGLLAFVDGSCETTDDELCRRRDRLVKGWIMASIGKDALGAVVALPTARSVWLELEKIFTPTHPEYSTQAHASPLVSKEKEKEKDKEKEKEKEKEKVEAKQEWVPPKGENARDMYKAAQRGEWEMAEQWFREDMERTKATISHRLETPLHVAVRSGKSNKFVKKLLELLPDEAVALQDKYKETALHYAAKVGNKEAAVMLVNRKPDLQYITNDNDRLPVQLAAIHCQKEILIYLIEMADPHVQNNSPFVGNLGIRLLTGVIASEFFDVALDLVGKYPDMAKSTTKGDKYSALSSISQMTSAFPHAQSFSCWHNFIYSCIPSESSTRRPYWKTPNVGDIENHTDAPQGTKPSYFAIYAVWQKLGTVMRDVVQYLVPQVKVIGGKKLKHKQALELVKSLCEKVAKMEYGEAAAIYKHSIINAAKNGIHEIIQIIAETSPTAAFATDTNTGRDIFLTAARLRHENVFNLIYDMSNHKYSFYNSVDHWTNNIMHLCAKLAPPHKLNLVTGAALQMQRELQWFKEVEKFVDPSRRDWPNKEGNRPRMLFSKEHSQLKAEGEAWMKGTANSCSIAATLIATVVFTAAFTVPGGLDSESGIPIFHDRFPFLLFVMSDVVSLFTSLTSLLMFLSILTSRYAEEDFLYVLPQRLSMGLLTLFVSITFMMAAFAATLYLMVAEKEAWILVLVASLACLPIASFVLLQFPLLLDVVYSTYGPGIFGNKTPHLFHSQPTNTNSTNSVSVTPRTPPL